ncbi:D-alanyl-D-alanine carboxypeptidase family protein [Streptomyces sp. NPDC016675]|uniref:D-alanyl-D-alanine carboxypeptidase family protein n=1 Tax=Streptomyces sp. NPDC016675 TaxID=3364970 RepID=UPI0036F6BC4C
MTRTAPSVSTGLRRKHRLRVVGPIVTTAAITAVLVCQLLTPSPSASSAPSSSPPPNPSSPSAALSPSHSVSPHREHHGRLGAADGVVPEGVTVLDDDVPAVAELDPDPRKTLRPAAKDAARENNTAYVNSGRRSLAHQNQLLREAVAKHGSEEQAARWVATAKTSAHVSGEAVGIGHSDAAAWLPRHGAAYGLCPIYRSEPWHNELRPDAIDHGCPAMYAAPAQDPRMNK